MTPEEQADLDAVSDQEVPLDEQLRVLRAQIAVLEVAADRHDTQIQALVVAILSTMNYTNAVVDHMRAEGTDKEPETFAALKKSAMDVMELLDKYGKSATDSADALHKIAVELQGGQGLADG